MHPQCKITVDGNLVSGVFMERLMSCEVRDSEGIDSDSVSIELNDFPPAAIPRRGAIIRVWMGYQETGMSYLGAFTADEITAKCFPHTLSISGKGADFRATMKEPKSRHWDETTLGDIITEIAGDHGLTPKIDEAIGAFQMPWVGQLGESDLEFMRRMADKHNALFSIKDGAVIFAERGSGKSPGGRDLGKVTVVPERLIVGSAAFKFADRSEFSEVVASWHDRDSAETKTTSAPSGYEGGAKFVLGEPLMNEAEAKAKAGAKAKELKRATVTASCAVVGDPSVRAGMGLAFKGIRPGVDGLEFIIQTAGHLFAKNRFETTIDGELKV